MSGHPAAQEYAVGRRGQRYPVHTRGLDGACVCNGCHQRRWWTKARRRARGELVRAGFAAGTRRKDNGARSHPACWTPQEDARLRELAPHHDCLTIGRMLGGPPIHKPRSENAVKHRCRRLGIARMDVRPLSSSEVGRIFGISRETVRVRFVASGMLVGTVRRGGPHGMRMFARAEIERVIREHPEAYDVDAIRDSALRALAVSVTRGRRLLTTTEVSRLTGVDGRTLGGWYARGLVPEARKVRGVKLGAGGAWLLSAGDVGTVVALRDGRAVQQRVRASARRDPTSGSFLKAGEIPSPDLRCQIRIVDKELALARLASYAIHLTAGGATARR